MTVKYPEIKGVTVTTHYPRSDKDMFGEYNDVTIEIPLKDKVLAWQYGDYYHDKGHEKAEAFVDALKLLYGYKLPVLKLRVADREVC